MAETHLDLCEIHQIGSSTREWIVSPDACPALSRRHIRLAGISRAERGFRFVRHRPDMRQVLVGFGGSGRVWTPDGWRVCREGGAYVTGPGTPHAYEAVARWTVGWVIFTTPVHAKPSAPALVGADPRPLQCALEGLQAELSGSRHPDALVHWAELVGHSAARIGAPDSASTLWLLWEEVRREPAAPWTLTRLAARAGLEPEQLRRVTQRETGRSPMRQVAAIRMREAASFLGMGYTVEATAQSVGYGNPFAFSTAFRRATGVPPSTMARRLQR
jgi:AraC-like DNA-binding protein